MVGKGRGESRREKERDASGSVGRPSSSLLNRPAGDWPHESRSSLYLPNGGRRRREEAVGQAARLISSCPSYGPGRVNELASRQGPTDLLSCSMDRRERKRPRLALCLSVQRAEFTTSSGRTERDETAARRRGYMEALERDRETERCVYVCVCVCIGGRALNTLGWEPH